MATVQHFLLAVGLVSAIASGIRERECYAHLSVVFFVTHRRIQEFFSGGAKSKLSVLPVLSSHSLVILSLLRFFRSTLSPSIFRGVQLPNHPRSANNSYPFAKASIVDVDRVTIGVVSSAFQDRIFLEETLIVVQVNADFE